MQRLSLWGLEIPRSLSQRQLPRPWQIMHWAWAPGRATLGATELLPETNSLLIYRQCCACPSQIVRSPGATFSRGEDHTTVPVPWARIHIEKPEYGLVACLCHRYLGLACDAWSHVRCVGHIYRLACRYGAEAGQGPLRELIASKMYPGGQVKASEAVSYTHLTLPTKA